MILMAVKLAEMDKRMTFLEQLQRDTGPVVLIKKFNVAPDDVELLLQAWTDDAAFMKQQPGYISTQLHRGIGGSTAFFNVLAAAFSSPRVPGTAARYPDSTVTAPHLREGRGPGDLHRLGAGP
jgi:hypothetical protein